MDQASDLGSADLPVLIILPAARTQKAHSNRHQRNLIGINKNKSRWSNLSLRLLFVGGYWGNATPLLVVICKRQEVASGPGTYTCAGRAAFLYYDLWENELSGINPVGIVDVIVPLQV